MFWTRNLTILRSIKLTPHSLFILLHPDYKIRACMTYADRHSSKYKIYFGINAQTQFFLSRYLVFNELVFETPQRFRVTIYIIKNQKIHYTFD